MTLDLNSALTVAETLARRAGVLLRESSLLPRHIEYKGEVDLVTDTDRASEAMIIGGLQEAFPAHGIVGEEGSNINGGADAEYCWYVDPLDGTTNFSHGVPHFSTSIALAGPDKLPLLGVVYDPNRDECFKAIRGQGGTLNGRPMKVSAASDISKCLLSTGFPRDRWTNPDNNLEELQNFVLRAHGVSRLGSAALDLCYVASGRLDGFWEMKIHSWDVMAGLLFVTEAGGRVTNYHGKTEGVYDGHEVVASNGLIHERMLTIIVVGNAAPRPGRKES